MENPPDVNQVKSSQTATTPATYWTAMINYEGGMSYIYVPAAGNLWVNYVPNQAAEEIFVWHAANAAKTPINTGENNITVSLGDVIIYKLANPATDSIKLGYQLT